MAVYSTAENKKDWCLAQTLESLRKTPDIKKHRIGLSVNAYTDETKKIFSEYSDIITTLVYNSENIGTAEAINKIWKDRRDGENAIKMDDDVVIHTADWLYLMEEAISRDNTIGQIGLKRRDCMESTKQSNPFFKSELVQLPHEAGQKWICVEQVNHVMGTCVMHSDALLKKAGYLFQMGQYGFDDVFYSLRSRLLGFKNYFLVGVDIEHIDKGDTPYQKWKEQKASERWNDYQTIYRQYESGERSLYYNPFQ